MMTGQEFEKDETEAGAGGAAGVEEPEGGGGPFLQVPADPADEGVREEEREIIQADDGGVDRFRREAGEEGEAHGQQMSKGDAVQKMKRDGPEEADLLSGALGRGGGEEAERAGDREA